MLRLSRMTDYGVAVMCELAQTPEKQRSAADVAERIGLAPTTVSKLLKDLGQASLVTSTRGAAGGYRLAQTIDDISIAAVIEALEGPTVLVACLEDGGNGCAVESSCPASGRWDPINAAVRSALEAVTLYDLLRSERPRRVNKTNQALEAFL